MNLARKENLTLTGILSLTLLSGLTLTLPSASADTDIVDDVAIEVPAACALTSTLNNNHEKEVNNGVYEPNIGKTTLKVTCNDSGGFSIYAIGFTGDTYTGEDHTKLIGADTGSKISTKVYVSSDTTSNWSMKLTPVSGSTISIENTFDNYHVVPDTYTKVATISSGTTPTTGASVETTYSAFMSGTQPADTYTGKVKYTMVHPSTNDTNSFVVNFFANGGAGTMSSQKISRGVATALSANTLTAPSGLGFAGWNTKFDGSGTTYANSALVTNLADAGETVNLYAMWEEVPYLQNLTADKCTTTMSTAIDSRDGTEYHIQRLADGKCWLLDNLALDLVTYKDNLNSSNTNASDEVLAYLKNGGGSGQYPANGVIAKTSNSGSWTSSYTDPYIATGYISTVPQGNNDPLKTETSNGNWKIGVYYNYCAASAGSYCYSTSNAPTDTQNGVRNIDADICPKGWRLPTGNSNGEFKTLSNAVTGSTSYPSTSNNGYGPFRTALRLPLSGYFRNGSADDQGSYGRWWSSTRDDIDYMYFLGAQTSDIYPASCNIRSFGFSVRCVLGS